MKPALLELLTVACLALGPLAPAAAATHQARPEGRNDPPTIQPAPDGAEAADAIFLAPSAFLPVCRVSVTSLAFQGPWGAAASRGFTVTNAGGGLLTGVVQSGSSSCWVEPSSYSLSGGQSQEFTATYGFSGCGESWSIDLGTACAPIVCTATIVFEPAVLLFSPGLPDTIILDAGVVGGEASHPLSARNFGADTGSLRLVLGDADLGFSLDDTVFVLSCLESATTYVRFHPLAAGEVTTTLSYSGDGQPGTVVLCGRVAPTGVGNALPATVLRLHPNRPNPFNPRTTLRYDLPGAGPVRLAIYDVSGRLVRILVEGERSAGSHEAIWDGRDAGNRAAPSGSYLARLEAGGKVERVRLTLVR